MAELRPVTLITGASAGIGHALARVFAKNGHEVVLVARREQLLANLADEIAATGAPRPTVLPADVSRIDTARRIGDALAAAGLEPEIVVNNAGFGLLGPAATLDRGEQLAMIDLNVRALTDLSLAFIEALERRKGGILNVASVAAFMPGPGMAVYYATKAYVLSFTEALHYEFVHKGVRVTALCPGPVATEFQACAGIKSMERVRVAMRTADRVAEDGYKGLREGARVVVPGFANQVAAVLAPVLPRGFIMRVSAANYFAPVGRVPWPEDEKIFNGFDAPNKTGESPNSSDK